MIPKIISLIIIFIMMLLVISPIKFAMFYFIFRPLVQPFATEGFRLIAGIPLTSIFALMVIAYSIMVCIIRKDYTFFSPNSLFFYIIVLFSVFSFINTLDYTFSIGHLLKILTAVAMSNLVYNSVKTQKDAKMFLWALALSSILPMFFGYYEVVASKGHVTFHGETARATGGFGFSNIYGIYLTLILCDCMMLIIKEESLKYIVILSIILASVLASTVLALNRGTWISLSFSILLSSIFFRKKIKIKWFIIVGLIITLSFSSIIIKRFTELGETTASGMSKNTFSQRIENWKLLLELAPNHPIIGYGIGTSQHVFLKYYKIEHLPHNDYMRLLLEIGILGPLIYIIFLLRALINLMINSTKYDFWYIYYPMMIGILYIIVLSFTQNIIHNVIVYPMFLTLLAISIKWNKLPAQ
ncbi:hypothetical protein DSCO28_64360 [Desulfosarcina ovata subsp. sediminis]|uniref:O-antigen ligase-related domain-containing protein n=1 Tax=Desulfosarcina ovata subsp. sediminis TaxID=885957 RepID=A0A5K8A0L6_9BACT|nr:O-antigen ligase family protein [Desulfosarcina ovata]BBO85870.1 hypothetical protein DSCO28_64360 [Desulfosarcina ovata subsp. sediminis]